ncbi:MAG: ABC transporter ATP-binding protein [Patescibacteria group bacterium]
MQSLYVIWHTFKRYRWHLVVLVILGFLGAILEGIGINAIIPLLSFFTGGSPSTATDFISRTIQLLFSFFGLPFTFRYLLGFILGLFLFRALSQVMFGYIRGWINADFLSNASEDMLRHTLYASWPFLLRQKIGALHNTLVRDIQVAGGLLATIGQAIQSFSGLLMYLLVAINISPHITLLTMGGGVILIVFIRPLLARTQKTGEEVASTEKRFAQFLTEHIIGMKAIKAAGREVDALAYGNRLVQFLRSLMIRQAFIRSISTSMFQPFSIFFIIVLFAVTYRTPDFSIISFAAALYLIQKIFIFLESGQVAAHSIVEMVPYARNISMFKNMLEEHREQTIEGRSPFNFAKALTFESVSFSYEKERPVLQNISFTIHHGETIGLIGPSGAGKTSVADLLLRLFKPTQGIIALDGKNITEIAIDDWRKQIGYVPQDVFLLNHTIEENIRFYRPELTKEQITEAARQANIYEFIMSLKEGFQTQVGDRGVMLSGGQRQRIVLARALAGRPSILILDEATSALDLESERLIQEAIQALHGSVTVFVIAHRLSTIESVDTLLVIENGRVIEQGSPMELRKNPNSYFTKHHDLRRAQ